MWHPLYKCTVLSYLQRSIQSVPTYQDSIIESLLSESLLSDATNKHTAPFRHHMRRKFPMATAAELDPSGRVVPKDTADTASPQLTTKARSCLR